MVMMRFRLLRCGFVVYGVVMATAIVFVFLPNAGMAWIGRTLALPPFEVTPVFEYMARGMSALCFLAGVFFIYAGLHLDACASLIRFLGGFVLLFLPMVVAIHAKLPTPWWWKAGDVLGVLLLAWLCRATPRPATCRDPGDSASAG